MSLDELSVEFDLMYNNISSNMAPGLSEYEKSVFLTQAQDAVVLDLYKGAGGDSFESTEEVTRYLNTLVESITLDNLSIPDTPIFKDKTYTFSLNNIDKLLFILYQSAVINVEDNNRYVLVVPSTLDTVYKEMENPFKGPNKNRVLSLSSKNNIEILSDYEVKCLYLKYLRSPYPIILNGALDDMGDLTINGETESKELEMPESTHMSILLRAVQLAQTVWKS